MNHSGTEGLPIVLQIQAMGSGAYQSFDGRTAAKNIKVEIGILRPCSYFEGDGNGCR
jgi:hypothetical protein